MSDALTTAHRGRIFSPVIIAAIGMLAATVGNAEVREVEARNLDRQGIDEPYGRDGRLDDRDIRKGHGTHPGPHVEVIVDGVSAREPAQRKVGGTDDGGPSICRQAHSIAWSTRELECPEPQPAPRSNVWSTSP